MPRIWRPNSITPTRLSTAATNLVANGRVYVGTPISVAVFGLLPLRRWDSPDSTICQKKCGVSSLIVCEVRGRCRRGTSLATFWRRNGISSGPRGVPDRSGPCPSVRWCCPGLFRFPEGSCVSPGCRTALSIPPACQNSSHIDERVCNHPESDPPFHPCVSRIAAAV